MTVVGRYMQHTRNRVTYDADVTSTYYVLIGYSHRDLHRLVIRENLKNLNLKVKKLFTFTLW